MSPKLKRLSGTEVISIFRKLGFRVKSQRGGHAKLARVSTSGAKQVLTIPIHEELDTSTLHAIFRQASRFVAEEKLRPHFYSE